MAKSKKAKATTTAKKTSAVVSNVAPNKIIKTSASKEAKAPVKTVSSTLAKSASSDAAAMKTKPEKSTAKISLGSIIIFILIIALLVFGINWIVKKVQSDKMEKSAREIIDYLAEMSGGLTIETWTWKGLGATGMYEMEFTFADDSETPYTSYITKDGKMIYTGDGYLIEDLRSEMSLENSTDSTGSATSTEDISKSATPMLSAFIVSQCPYGVQAQKVMLDAITAAPEIANHLEARYFFSSINAETGEVMAMHGQEEANENVRQICLREEQPKVYWPYVSCIVDGGTAETCITTAGVNANDLNACITDLSRGITYAQEDQNLADSLGVTGSPTLFINSEQEVTENNFGGRTAEGYKTIVCASADNALSFCNQTLSETSSAVSGDC